jgi:hypothetical protein
MYIAECQTVFRIYTADWQNTECILLNVRQCTEYLLLRDRKQNVYCWMSDSVQNIYCWVTEHRMYIAECQTVFRISPAGWHRNRMYSDGCQTVSRMSTAECHIAQNINCWKTNNIMYNAECQSPECMLLSDREQNVYCCVSHGAHNSYCWVTVYRTYNAECQAVSRIATNYVKEFRECSILSVRRNPKYLLLTVRVQLVYCCISDRITISRRKNFLLMNFSTHLKYKRLPNHFVYQQLTVTRLTLWQQQQIALTDGNFSVTQR